MADWRNAVIINGFAIHALGWVNDVFDDRLVIDGEVSEFTTLREALKDLSIKP